MKTTGTLSDKKKAEYNGLLSEEEHLKELLLEQERDKVSLDLQLNKIDKEISRDQNELDNLERNLHISSEKRKQVEFTENLRTALEEVKERLKSFKRQEIEDAFNKYLPQLLTSTSLISRVDINDHFEITYLDHDNNEVVMSAVSAGMKQILATVLLWSLKVASGREIPVIIDTPMGRIDRLHQSNLLEAYYPKVAKQVILLPTDSELDKAKFEQLKPNIYQVYKLHNPNGIDAEIQPIDKDKLYG